MCFSLNISYRATFLEVHFTNGNKQNVHVYMKGFLL